jgi:hypothetical protein
MLVLIREKRGVQGAGSLCLCYWIPVFTGVNKKEDGDDKEGDGDDKKEGGNPECIVNYVSFNLIDYKCQT